MILLLDNYDSFTYNLFQMVGSIEPDLKVVRNDAMTVSEIRALNPDGIIISPGPGRPEDAGICPEVIKELKGEYPILGVCLGEQAICMVYGATVGYAKELMHGKQSDTKIDTTSPLFRGLPELIKVARYHSLAVVEETLKDTGLTVSGVTTDGEVMAVEDRENRVYGLQFHPESIMTPEGEKILRNFIELTKKH
ncbi:MAG: aminodeoxychorismate/anthranilate synthase component II [Oribacterium sp.]|nr:aminodeoxychorismate/anthranilate synthase component II [Oribacterium sp.]